MLVRAVRRLTTPVLESADRFRERRRARRWRGLSGGGDPVQARERLPFSRDDVLRAFSRTVTIEGRDYHYVLYPGRGDTLVVHFSAFFGEWGDRRENRSQFQGHFHRLRMFWPQSDRAFLFLCDTFGADDNGTYYKGVAGDFFVERAVRRIIAEVQTEVGVPAERTVLAGSSMGATAALRLALKDGTAGAVAVCPHIDLDLCARFQGRQRHVAAVVGREDVEAEDLFAVTREIRALVERTDERPRIVVQSMKDDHGVHEEQVLPFVASYRSRGGTVVLDERATGGHTSDHATPAWFAEQFAGILERPGAGG